MTTYYTIDTAERRLPDLRDVLETLRDQRADLVRLRDKMLERITALQSATAGGSGGSGPSSESELRGSIEQDATIRSLRLRMQGIVDQMQAGVARIDEWDVTLRDIETGLIDFPALANGRPIWLCWRLGEDGIEWWHEHDAGFGSRRPLMDLE